jgi:hypothetical protein
VQIRQGESWFIEHPEALDLGGSDNDEELWPAHVRCKPKKDAEDAAKIASRNTIIDKGCADKPHKGRGFQTNRDGKFKKTFYHGTVRRE